MAINKYDKPVESNYIPRPLEQYFALGQQMKQSEMQAEDLTQDILESYNVNALSQDVPGRNRRIQELEAEISKISDLYKKDPMQALSMARKLKRQAHTELTRGELAGYQSNYNLAAKYRENMDDLIKAGWSPDEAKLHIESQIGAFPGTTFDKQTGNWNQFSGSLLPNAIDENKWIQDNIKNVAEDSQEIISGLTSSETKAVQQLGWEQAFAERKLEGKTMQKIFNSLALLAEGDTDLRRSLEAKGMLRTGQSGLGNVIQFDPETGQSSFDESGILKTQDTPFTRMLKGASYGAAYQNQSLDLKIRDNALALHKAKLSAEEEFNKNIDFVSQEVLGGTKAPSDIKQRAFDTFTQIASMKNPDGSPVLSKEVVAQYANMTPYYFSGGLFDYSRTTSHGRSIRSPIGNEQKGEINLGNTFWEKQGGVKGWDENGNVRLLPPKGKKGIEYNGKTYTNSPQDLKQLEHDVLRDDLAKQMEQNPHEYKDFYKYATKTASPFWDTSSHTAFGEYIEEKANTQTNDSKMYVLEGGPISPLYIPKNAQVIYKTAHEAGIAPTSDGPVNMSVLHMYSDKELEGYTPIEEVRGHQIGLNSTSDEKQKVFYKYAVGMENNLSPQETVVINDKIGIKQGTVQNSIIDDTKEDLHHPDIWFRNVDRRTNTETRIGQPYKINILDEKAFIDEGIEVPIVEEVPEVVRTGPMDWTIKGEKKTLSEVEAYIASYRNAKYRKMLDAAGE